jgi:hypothetical protein
VSLDAQVTARSMSGAPLDDLGTAMSRSVSPTKIDGAAGVTATDATGGGAEPGEVGASPLHAATANRTPATIASGLADCVLIDMVGSVLRVGAGARRGLFLAAEHP